MVIVIAINIGCSPTDGCNKYPLPEFAPFVCFVVCVVHVVLW